MSHGLEQKAEQNITESIEKLAINSFLMLLFESIMADVNPKLKDALKEKSVKDIYKYYQSTVNELESILSGSKEEKETALDKCAQMKLALLDIYGSLKTSFAACNIIDSCFDEWMYQAERKSAADFDSFEAQGMKGLFISALERFMARAAELEVEEQAASILFAMLPNYFTDKEFFDYINYSAGFYYEHAPINEARLHSITIMQHFAPHKFEGFGKYYLRLNQKIRQMMEEIGSEDFNEGFKKKLSGYTKTYASLEGISEAIASIYIGLTYVTVLLSSELSFREITRDHFVYLDLYHKTRELLSTKDYEAMGETLLFAIDTEVEKEIVTIEELSKRKDLIYKNVNIDNFTEKTKQLFSRELFMTNAFYENIENELTGLYLQKEEHGVSYGDRMKEIKALSLFLKESCFGMNEALKRHARESVFAAVPLASAYESKHVLAYAKELCDKADEKALEEVYDTISKITDEGLLEKLALYSDELTED